MKHANAIKGPDSRLTAVADRSAARTDGGGQSALIADNRSESAQLKKMQLMAENSPQAVSAVQLQALADRSPIAVAQMKRLEGASDLIQRQGDDEEPMLKADPRLVQRQGDDEEPILKADPRPVQRQGDDEEPMLKADPRPVQRQGDDEEPMLKAAPVQMKENNTGMPDRLKSGVESLSGISMDDVKVHYNSDKPATLQALAYTQGTDIHVAPGQEKHLAHEAWHVAQQKQDRVKPTVQMAETKVNNDQGLELEADVMGRKALKLDPQATNSPRKGKSRTGGDLVAQKQSWVQQDVGFVENRTGNRRGTVTQRNTRNHSSRATIQLGKKHNKILYFRVSTVTIRDSVTQDKRYVNANHEEALGRETHHGAVPRKTQADAMAVAMQAVTLGPNEVILDVTWNHYTQ